MLFFCNKNIPSLHPAITCCPDSDTKRVVYIIFLGALVNDQLLP